MHHVYSTLPDDRPITSIGIIEDPDKCPPDYYVVNRTHDQDSDADLWKDGFFGRKMTRYLCLSKKTGLPDYIVESIAVVSDKEIPPDGYTLLPRTIDSEQKAWRKRQLCYRLSRRNLAMCSVTDVIVLSRMKKAPEGFSLAGEINGLTVCFKTGPRPPLSNVSSRPVSAPLAYSLTPGGANSTPSPLPHPRKHSSNGISYPSPAPPAPLSPTTPEEYGDDYVCLRPSRPAPPLPPASPHHSVGPASLPPQQQQAMSPPRPPPFTKQLSVAASASRNYATLAAFQGLEGVPFCLNSKIKTMMDPSSVSLPTVRQWTQYQLDREFEYDFRTEREASNLPAPS